MQRELYFRKSEDGVSPIIGTVLILGIMVTITGTMLAWGIPQIQQSEAYAIYTSAQNNLLNFDADMDQVILQGDGSSRSSTVSFSSGTFVLRENLDEIRYYYTTVPWSDPKIIGAKNGAKTFAMTDSKKRCQRLQCQSDLSQWDGLDRYYFLEARDRLSRTCLWCQSNIYEHGERNSGWWFPNLWIRFLVLQIFFGFRCLQNANV